MPETKELVINTMPILALIAAAGSLDMLPPLYHRVWVPLEVCREIQAGGADGFAIPEFERASWLQKQKQPVTLSPEQTPRQKNSVESPYHVTTTSS